MSRFQNTGMPDDEWWEELWPDPGETLRELGFQAGESVVDVGAGRGHFALPAAEIVGGAPVYAVDLDGDLLATLSKEAAAAQLDNVVTVEGDARDLPELVPDPVDVVLFANGFHGVESPVEFLRMARSMLRDDGRLVLINWHARPPEETTVLGEPRGPPTEIRMPATAAVDHARDAGFEDVESHDLEPYHYALVCR
ncbi:class I SAM-dependent methyltransferase [Haloarchaeobius sp. TZWWS8]|uniref:class I SAM-dependent methyltransferase n=1 Tax=Haloarchaeobius sp. TZWWS8 TaxID=3446121 RepID=UPI003EBA7783